MKNFISLSVMGAFVAFFGFTTLAMGADKTTAPLVLGYYPDWDPALKPEQINMAPFTHIAHAFVSVDTSGSLVTEGNMPSRELTSLARKAGVKTLVSVGGMNSGKTLGPVTADAERCRIFVQKLVTFAHENGYDGIDLDWEFPKSPSEKKGLVHLCVALREEMRRQGMKDGLLTAAVGGNPWSTRYFDAAALLPLLDYVFVMTYDAHGSWDEHSGHNAPLFPAPGDKAKCAANSAQGMITHWNKDLKWPKSKMALGIPCYGRAFEAESMHAPVKKGTKGKHDYLAFKNVAKMLADGWRVERDEVARVPVLKHEGVREVISFEDETSAKEKGAWARNEGLAGYFFWEITQDVVGGENKLVKAAREGWDAAGKKP